MKKLFVSLTSFLLFACAGPRQTPAPIENVSINANSPVSQPGAAKPIPVDTAPVETKIAKLNDDDSVAEVKPTPKSEPVVTKATEVSSGAAVSSAVIGGINWLTPMSGGKIGKDYSASAKGVDVSGSEGEASLASGDGVAIYSGKGPEGYGLLVIIKHKDNYLTAYSHNKVNLVKKDEVVKRGQKIAEVGATDANDPMLHFELRKHGKPVNPTKIFQ